MNEKIVEKGLSDCKVLVVSLDADLLLPLCFRAMIAGKTHLEIEVNATAGGLWVGTHAVVFPQGMREVSEKVEEGDEYVDRG